MTNIHRIIPTYTEADNVTGCCPVFHPEEYDNQVFDLSDYQFIKDSTLSFMYMPVNMDKVFTHAMNAINEDKQAYTDRYLILSKDINAFKCDHYFLTKGDVRGYETHKLEGKYRTKVYDGEFKDIPNWIKLFEKDLKENNEAFSDLYVFYTNCPNCAKVYGHNYVVLFGRIE